MIATTPRLSALIVAMSVLGSGGPIAALAQEQNVGNTEAVQTQDIAVENQAEGNSEINNNIVAEQEVEGAELSNPCLSFIAWSFGPLTDTDWANDVCNVEE
jgi:hypothetical protein